MAERKLIDRITDAVTQLRDPLPSKMLGDIELKGVEDRPDFGKGWSRSEPYRGWEQTFGFRDSGLIDYRRELGELDNSSLVMAVVNWTGINLAEALPVVTKPDEKGVPQIELQHEASDLIRRPNPFHIWADYCLAGAFSWWMGNWYMKKVRDKGGKLIELWYLPHYMVEPRWPGDNNGMRTHPERTSPGEKNGYAKLSDEQVREICRAYDAHEADQYELADRFHVWQMTISRIVRRVARKTAHAVH